MRMAWAVALLVATGIMVAGCSQASDPPDKMTMYTAKMTGDQELAKVKTTATGMATFTLSADKMEMKFKVTVAGITDVNGAHIHMGEMGKNGDPIAMMFTGPEKPGSFTGTLAEGTIKADGLVGPAKGKTIADLADMMSKGSVYVNVHTKANPDGEIRGQIETMKGM